MEMGLTSHLAVVLRDWVLRHRASPHKGRLGFGAVDEGDLGGGS